MKKLTNAIKSISVKMSANALLTTAAMFAVLMCNGKIYEPKLPQKFRDK